ncbi:MAG: hypothetical protein H6625_07100 [Bdellovibrionaceae bacterium]|nr:hypothetical protein [Pseudobdellovibrionaceae bacterium]
MQNNLGFIRAVQILFTCFTVISCSGLAKIDNLEPLKEPGSVVLKLKSKQDRMELVKYFSHSKVKSYEQNQLVREKDEIVEFKVESKILDKDKDNNFVRMIVTTLEKDGLVDLHDLAFPEVKERIEFVYKPNAEVVYAGGYPSSSVFYVPPLSLPESEVEVGDTWEMQRSWVSMKNNIPLKIQMVTILKNLYPCSGKDTCADLEISGDISIIAALDKKTNFNSLISGRIIFSIEKGSILWSLIKSSESLSISDSRMDVQSCLISNLMEPKEDVWDQNNESISCDPLAIEKFPIPRL